MGDFEFEVWPTDFRVITQHFGVNPRNYDQFGLPGHDGIDIKAPTGSKVYCVAPGEVFLVHDNPRSHNYGIHVRVQHQDGYKTIYAHLERALVKEGQIVKAGELLGTADNTGNSFGTHLHLTLKKDNARVNNWPHNIIDPTPFLLPLLGWKEPAGPYIEGWVLTDSIYVHGDLAQVNAGGATIYINPELKKLVPAGSIILPLAEQKPFTRVRVPLASIGISNRGDLKPAPEPPAIVSTVDGWASKHVLIFAGNQAIVGTHGVTLKYDSDQSGRTIGLVKANSTVSVLGQPEGRYIQVRVRRNDFIEPVNLPHPPPDASVIPPKEGYLGWVLTQYLTPLRDHMALASNLGVNLRNRPDPAGQNVGLVKAFATVRIAGPERREYSPVLVNQDDVLNAVAPQPEITKPEPWPDSGPPKTTPTPAKVTIPGWAFTNGLLVSGDQAKVAEYGSNLRSAPTRDADMIGFVPAGNQVIVTGPAQGEYTPIRVDESILESPDKNGRRENPDTPIMGQAQIGLHASADPDIPDEEHNEFAQMRPGIIKVLSFHDPADIRKLAIAHPKAQFIIRAFLSMEGRNISPGRFIADTISDVRRTLGELKYHDVVIELHNEPNVFAEGLGTSWSDGSKFNIWFQELLKRYREILPAERFIYPGLSPGRDVTGVKLDHIRFIEASRQAVKASDGLGVHLYWSQYQPMSRALETLDDYISRFRFHPIWVTEASYKSNSPNPAQMAQDYLRFWKELQTRPVVKGVTYFVASASNPEFFKEVWVGKGIGKLIGRR